VYADKRAVYISEELRSRIPAYSEFKVNLQITRPFFWKNLLLSSFEVFFSNIRNGKWPKTNIRTLYYNTFRRPDFIRRISLIVDKYVNSVNPTPSLILQWQAIFAPYINTPRNPFVLILDNYADSPNSVIQKDKLRRWETFYGRSFFDFQKELYNKSERIFTLSQWCKEGLIKEYGLEREKIHAIGWGPAKSISVPGFFKKEKNTILAIGKDYEAKGIDILLEASKYLDDFKITVVGRDNSFNESKYPNVCFYNNVDDNELLDLYRKSQFFFIFSEFDPSPHVIWEAQASGCVIIGYDAYGISEAVVKNESGILLKTREPFVVAEEILKLQQNEELVRIMQKASVNNYLKNGTWSEACNKLIQDLPLIF
jgi:glycosyltransferase involved in cell wall biosynthesis